LSAFGSLDYDYGWEYDSDGSSYTVGALLQWDIWDGNSTRAKVREARANLESAREEQRRLRFALDLEAEEARLALQSAEERLAASEKAVAQAEESVTMNRSRFEQGAALSSQLIDAQTALVAARVRRAEAETDQRIAIAALRKAYGFPQLDANPAASQEADSR
jgi:outer membrane protein TolC